MTTLAEQALKATELVSSDSIRSIEAMIAELDKKLTDQVNQILHHTRTSRRWKAVGEGCTIW